MSCQESLLCLRHCLPVNERTTVTQHWLLLAVWFPSFDANSPWVLLATLSLEAARLSLSWVTLKGISTLGRRWENTYQHKCSRSYKVWRDFPITHTHFSK